LPFSLRDYQKRAIQTIETALADDATRSMLLAMATGTGKTKLAIALLYRLLETKRFRRVCFVVDRYALGEQAANEFKTTRMVGAHTFANIFPEAIGRRLARYRDQGAHLYNSRVSQTSSICRPATRRSAC
jgi:type I site-specific restriction endonuclease